MKKSYLFVAAVTTMCCSASFAMAPPGNRATGPRPRLRMLGVVSEPAPPTTPRTYAFASLDEIRLGGQSEPVRTRLPLATPDGQPEPVEVSQQAVKIEVLQRSPTTYKYNVLFGPKLCTSSSASPVFCPGKMASGWVESYNGTHTAYKGVMTFHLQQGWAFVWSNPSLAVAKSEWVIGATDGSEMILEIVNDTTQRVYFIKGTKITVACEIPDNTSGQTSWPTTGNSGAGRFITITKAGNNCDFSAGWLPIPSGTTFVNEAKKIAEAAGKLP